MEHENVRTDMEVLQYGRNKNGEQDLDVYKRQLLIWGLVFCTQFKNTFIM